MKRFQDYLQVGRYTKIVFPSFDVRFIVVNDGFALLVMDDVDLVQQACPFRSVLFAEQSFQELSPSHKNGH